MKTMYAGVVIVGAGLAGVSVAESLRNSGFTGPVALVSEEPHAPYDRPPLSKQFMLNGDADSVGIGTDVLKQVDFHQGERIDSVDAVNKRVVFASGKELAWNKLVLATGALPHRLVPLEAGPLPAFVLRTLGDAQRIRELLVPGARLVMVGGGPIGLELAVSARKLGADVTVVELTSRLMGRCTSPFLAEFLVQHHARNGINIRLGRMISQVHADGTVELDDATRIGADLLVVGVGVRANDALAAQAGLACSDGIFVDAFGRTTAPDVFAVGDVTRQRNPVSGQFERIETWANAKDQAISVTSGLLDARLAVPYTAVPWYWSEQGDLRIQAAGMPIGDAEVIRGDPDHNRFLTLQLRRGTLVGVAAVNAVRDFGICKKLIAAGARIDRARLADPGTDLRILAADAGKANAA